MLQVASFALPGEQDKANEFLATHKTASTNFNKDMIVVFWDDGITPPAYQIADLQELLQSNRDARFQQEVSLHVMKAEQADLKHGSGRFAELDNAIIETKAKIDNQDLKAAFVEQRIAELKGNG